MGNLGRDGPSGKLLSLVYLLREHGEALEADFQHHYGLELLDLYRGKISPRRAALLALKLPAGSVVWQEMGGPLAWTVQDYFAAAQLHAAQVNNWLQTEDGQNGRNPPALVEHPPYAKDRERETDKIVSQAERFLARQKARKAQQEGEA